MKATRPAGRKAGAVPDGLSPSREVRWVVEQRGVRVFGLAGQSRFLEALEAAWDLVSRGDSLERASAKLAAIGNLSPQAGAQLRAWAKTWMSAGWLAEEAGDG